MPLGRHLIKTLLLAKLVAIRVRGDFALSQVYVWDRTDIDPNTNVRRVSMAPGGQESGQVDSRLH